MQSRLRSILAAFGLLLACSFRAAPIVTSQTTFQFTGVCSDCTGTGIGTLVLQNYVQDGHHLLQPDNFVSFTYTSNLTSFTIPSGASNFNIDGTFPATLPASPSITITGNGNAFESVAPTGLAPTGSWCAGAACGEDVGTTFTWGAPSSPTTTTASPTPALNDWMLASLAMALAVMGSILVKKIQARKA